MNVAICIPSYESTALLKRLLDSIVIQTYQEYTVVVSDDSRTDDIKNLLDGYDSKQFLYYKNSEKSGATANTNRAIKLAKELNPKYIKVMHHDDFFSYPDSLEQMVDAMDQNPNASLFFCGNIEVFDDCSKERMLKKTNIEQLTEDYRILFTKNCVGAPSVTMVRNIDTMLDEKLSWLVDVDWYMRILSGNSQFCYSENLLVSIGHQGFRMTDYCVARPGMVLYEYLRVMVKRELHLFSYKNVKHILRVFVRTVKNKK